MVAITPGMQGLTDFIDPVDALELPLDALALRVLTSQAAREGR